MFHKWSSPKIVYPPTIQLLWWEFSFDSCTGKFEIQKESDPQPLGPKSYRGPEKNTSILTEYVVSDTGGPRLRGQAFFITKKLEP